MSRKPKYDLAAMNVGDKIKIPTNSETAQNDLHRLRSAISQYKRLHNKPDVSFKISLNVKFVVCERVS